MSAAETSRSVPDVALLSELAAFLYHEAELLDQRRLEQWLELYLEDAVYWVPQGPDDDPQRDVQLLFDDRRRLRERVLRLSSGFAYAQDPPSRTLHLIGNVRTGAGTGAGADAGAGAPGPDVEVLSAQLITELRRERQAQYAAHVRHLLAPVDGGWRIRRKEIRLVNGDVPLGNLTFLI